MAATYNNLYLDTRQRLREAIPTSPENKFLQNQKISA